MKHIQNQGQNFPAMFVITDKCTKKKTRQSSILTKIIKRENIFGLKNWTFLHLLGLSQELSKDCSLLYIVHSHLHYCIHVPVDSKWYCTISYIWRHIRFVKFIISRNFLGKGNPKLVGKLKRKKSNHLREPKTVT